LILFYLEPNRFEVAVLQMHQQCIIFHLVIACCPRTLKSLRHSGDEFEFGDADHKDRIDQL